MANGSAWRALLLMRRLYTLGFELPGSVRGERFSDEEWFLVRSCSFAQRRRRTGRWAGTSSGLPPYHRVTLTKLSSGNVARGQSSCRWSSLASLRAMYRKGDMGFRNPSWSDSTETRFSDSLSRLARTSRTTAQSRERARRTRVRVMLPNG